MNSQETGHVKNIANFESLINFCAGFGPAYQPSRAALNLDSLRSKLDASKAALAECNSREVTYDNEVDARMTAFKDLKPLSTKVTNALIVSGVSGKIADAVKSINRKMQGARATARPATADGAPQKTTISSAQQGFDTRLEHFQVLIELVATQPEYAPNEETLKVSTLKALLLKLYDHNNRVSKALVDWSNARRTRNELMYKPTEGLTDLALDVKKYIKSVSGATGPEYKQVKSILFTRRD